MYKSILTMIFMVGVVVGRISGPSTTTRPPYIGCQSNLECTAGHCCSIGRDRYSIPICKPFREEGERCIPNGHKTVNTTVYYPDGSGVELTDVHVMFCPCVYGFSCNSDDMTCHDASQKRGFNHLLGETSAQDD